MTEQLELLILLQDLDIMIQEAEDEKLFKSEEKLGFKMDGIDKLKKTRKQLTLKIDAKVLQHYEKVVKRYRRAVVPVKDKICLGCFMKQPAITPDEGDLPLRICERCSRIQYSIDDI